MSAKRYDPMKSIATIVKEVGINNRHGGKEIEQEFRQLPLWHDLERAMPNAIARSALFAPVARGRRVLHERAEIASRGDIQILYSGKQLDMADADVFMQALELAKRVPLDTPFSVNRAEFLRAIHRSTGKSQYEWLDSVMQRLKFTVVTCKVGTQMVELSLIAKWGRDSATGEYFVQIDGKILQLFAGQQYSLIDWQTRYALTKRIDLAKWMQTYIASNERGEQRIGMVFLQKWSSYNSPARKFREALTEALDELVRVGVIANPRIEERNGKGPMVIFTRL